MKLKRFLTTALSALMALSVCALPVMAEGTNFTTSTIDRTQRGSITIYKYLREDDKTGPNGDGENTPTALDPESQPLNGIGFTVYQVMDTNTLMKYYEENATTDTVTVDTFWDKINKKFVDDKIYPTSGVGWSGAETETTVNGSVTFSNLPVGMYLVRETKTLSVVKSPVEPFLVSIPMTRIGDTTADESQNNNLKQWLYDVKVYPKNTTTTGTVNINKKGAVGSDTTNATVLGGVKFNLYKFDDATGNYLVCKDSSNKEIEYTTNSATGIATANNLTKGKYYFKEVGYTDDAKKTGYIADTTSVYPFAINNDGYVVENTDTFANATTAPTFVVGTGAQNKDLTIYNYKPDFEKNVKDDNGDYRKDKSDPTKTTHDADYGIGDKVPYVLTITVPANVDKLHTFKVTDKTDANQLKYVDGSVKITDSTNATYTYTNNEDSKVTINADKNELVIDFKAGTSKAKLEAAAGGTITIEYLAEVQPGAEIAGSKGNLNTADLIYSSTTDVTTDEDDKQPYMIEDQGVVYSFSVNIEKEAKGGDKNGQKLKDVEFVLYKEVENEKLDTTDTTKYVFRNAKCEFINAAAAKKLGLTENGTKDWIIVKTLTTDENGKATEKGLPFGNYKLVETKTVDGYNLLSEPVDVNLKLDYTTDWKIEDTYDDSGRLVKHKYDSVTFTNEDNQNVDEPEKVITIINRAGFNLPVTGGFGTLLFSGIGVLLVLGGVSVLFSLKKKNGRA